MVIAVIAVLAFALAAVLLWLVVRLEQRVEDLGAMLAETREQVRTTTSDLHGFRADVFGWSAAKAVRRE